MNSKVTVMGDTANHPLPPPLLPSLSYLSSPLSLCPLPFYPQFRWMITGCCPWHGPEFKDGVGVGVWEKCNISMNIKVTAMGVTETVRNIYGTFSYVVAAHPCCQPWWSQNGGSIILLMLFLLFGNVYQVSTTSSSQIIPGILHQGWRVLLHVYFEWGRYRIISI